MKTFKTFLSTLLIISACYTLASAQGSKQNTLSKPEKKAGWQLLFDGKTFNGWRGLNRDHVPAVFWEIKDGTIHKLKNDDVKRFPDASKAESGDLVTTEEFTDFELSFEWKIDKAGNSGLKYNVSEEMCKKYNSTYSALGFEYQLLDDGDPMYKSLHASQYSGSLYDLIPAKNITLKPIGEFNQSRIVVKRNHGEHWLNGVKVVDYEFGSDELKNAWQKSKFNKMPEFIVKRKARIVLQNHNDEAWFRNIKIRKM